MKKLFIFVFLISSSLIVLSQTPKKVGKKINKKVSKNTYSRNYNGCFTKSDSLVRESVWMTFDTLRAYGYIKN